VTDYDQTSRMYKSVFKSASEWVANGSIVYLHAIY